MLDPIVPDPLEKWFSFRNDREIVNAMADPTVSGDDFLQARVLHEGHPLFHEVDLRDDW